MLTDSQRREMREMAGSIAIRDEFRRLKTASTPPAHTPIDLDRLLDFLTAMTRLSAQPASPRRFIAYSRVLL